MEKFREIVYFDRKDKPFEVLKTDANRGKRYDLKGIYDLVCSNPHNWKFIYGENVDSKLRLEESIHTFRKSEFDKRESSFLEQ